MKKRILSIMLTICMVLVLVPAVNAMEIYVDLHIVGGTTLTLNVESGDSIYNLKSKIKDQTGYNIENQVLEFAGKVLENGKTLVDYKIQKESTLVLSLSISLSHYATKNQLMERFEPSLYNISKLVFGKNSSGESQEWYILGKDTGVSGENTIIFAASPITTNHQFDSSTNDKTYNFEAGTGYGESEGSITVNANHYGASLLRGALQNMATNTSYFTSDEQGLMNATTVTTYDNYDTNNIKTYTTTDKLYALAGGYEDTTIKAGSGDSTVLSMNSYWSSGAMFWLRSPRGGNSKSLALLANPGNYVYGGGVDGGYAVQPASNLNLSSVLFASAATVASSGTESGKIADGTAMTLRFDGTGKNIGTVTYDTTTGDIKANKGSTTGDVALVVQGNDGTNDWYYSKQISGTETVNVLDIKSALGLSTDIDLAASKIWLEITDTDGLIYAVGATGILSSVAITGIETPAVNTALSASASCATTGVSNTAPTVAWTPDHTTAGYNTSYTASVILTAETGYEFTASTTATVNGNTATSVTNNQDGTLTVTYAFSPTEKDRLISITAPQAITVANGTTYDKMNLPATVSIVTEGNTVTVASVTWDTANGNYDSSVLTEQTVTLNGTVICPDSIDTTGVSLNTTITINISAAGIVGAPQANLTSGTYSSNQTVILTSSTDDAVIYYTTDGSEPSRASTIYNDAITVMGTKGMSVTTTIKAIAVKDKMQDSDVMTFTYTITIPNNTIPTLEIKFDTNKTYSSLPTSAILAQLGKGMSTTVKLDKGVIVGKEIFSALSGKNITLKFITINGTKVVISFEFSGNNINESKPFNTGVTFTSDFDALIKSQIKGNIKILNFAHNGTLPGPARVTVDVSDIFADGTTLELSVFNEATKSLETVTKGIVVTDGKASFDLDHCSVWVLSEAQKELDLCAYSNYGLNVYENSRVTSVAASANGFDVDGYMWIDGEDATTNTWREIVFVNAEDADTSKAYRKSVTPVYNTWLNNNMTATKNGEISLDYANYEVTVDPTNIQNYTKTSTGAMASGTYLVYMRISDGKDSYLFPLVDRELSDGTTMESKGTLPDGFSIIDSDTRALVYTVK